MPLPTLPDPLRDDPVIVISNDPRPRGMRIRVGPKQVVLPPDSFEHFLSILAGHPDPDNTELDFIRHDSATSESCRLRASVGRMRDHFERAFAAEPDAAAARNVIVTIEREKTYVLHPELEVRIDPTVERIDPMAVRREVLAALFAKYLAPALR